MPGLRVLSFELEPLNSQVCCFPQLGGKRIVEFYKAQFGQNWSALFIAASVMGELITHPAQTLAREENASSSEDHVPIEMGWTSCSPCAEAGPGPGPGAIGIARQNLWAGAGRGIPLPWEAIAYLACQPGALLNYLLVGQGDSRALVRSEGRGAQRVLGR